MRVVKPGADRETPRGIVGGAEISQTTVGASNIYMGRYRVPPGSRSRPHYHDGCESALYMLTGGIRILWGDHLEQSLELTAGDMLYVPPGVTHVVENTSPAAPADYVVARDSPQEDAVVVPWADAAA
jgi:uncharacterized RmlC-like cupin family protein